MTKLNQKLNKIRIITMVIFSVVFYSCEKTENKTEDKVVVFAPELRTESLRKGNGLVPLDVAFDIAEKFNPKIFFDQTNKTNYSKKVSTLDGHNKVKNHTIIKDSNEEPAFYIFNYENDKGFIFVSADYKMQPILAFFEDGEFKKDIVPGGLLMWVDKTIENIEILKAGKYDNSKDANFAWNNYYSHNLGRYNEEQENPCLGHGSSSVAGPLLNVTWGQGPTYNELCPNLSCTNSNSFAYTGCVATATAQVVRYWRPNNQFNYNYTNMSSTQGNLEVRRLMRDIGTKVNMNYGCQGSSASGASVALVLMQHFGLTYATNSDYNYMTVQNNVNTLKPVLMTGCTTSSGNWFIINWGNSYTECHQWVCDGSSSYSSVICENEQVIGHANYSYFHMNWGWNEVGTNNNYNGWFSINNWNINGNNLNFKYCNKLTHEIRL